MSYVSSGNKNEEEKEDNNVNNNNKSNVFYKKLSKDDFEFIKRKTKELGENFEINDYNEKINRLNEGIKNIIQNFEKLSEIHKKNTQALQNIVNNDNNYKKTNKAKINDDEDVDEDIDDNNNKINHKNNIEKIKNYCKIQRNFIEQKLENSIKKIKKYQIFLQELLDIYSRKKEHLSYLGRLHSQKEELEKQNSANEDPLDPLIKKKINELEDQLNHEIKFIKKINKDLKYEIDNYKDNQEDIYIYINSIFKDKSIYIKDCISTLNREDFVEDEEEKNEGEHKSKIEQSKKSEYCDENKGDDF